MLSEAILADIQARAGHDAPVRFDEVTGSTNARAAELAASGAPEWTLVAAGHQTAGRGRLDRTWVDDPGAALLVSIVLRPSIRPDLAGLISLVTGVAMAEAASRRSRGRVGCKWPNDLLVDGRKVGGILAESLVEAGRLAHVVVGVGVNLGEPPSGVSDAGALEDVSDARLLEEFLLSLDRHYHPSDPGFAPAAVAAARASSVTLGRHVRATTSRGGVVEGRAVDLDERGGLIVQTPERRETVSFGDVEYVEMSGELAEDSGRE